MRKFNYFLLRVLLQLAGIEVGAAAAPSFDCRKAAGAIEQMICSDDGLAALDRALAEVYAAAAQKAVNEHPPVLKAEQRGWIKGRNDCWKSADQRKCVEQSYRRRIAELQARYRLVPANGPFWYACDGDPGNEVVVTFFKTDPPTLEAERGDQVALMYLEPSASGSKYRGRNELLWEHQGEATIVWGYGRPEMRCRKQPSAAQLAASDGAAHLAPALADVPVVDMGIVDPAEYEAASELAARGSAPLDIALKIAGKFEGSAQHIIQVNAGREAPSTSRLTVLRDGLLDDSVRSVRWEITLEKMPAGVWRISKVARSWRCRRGAQTERFAAALCP